MFPHFYIPVFTSAGLLFLVVLFLTGVGSLAVLTNPSEIDSTLKDGSLGLMLFNGSLVPVKDKKLPVTPFHKLSPTTNMRMFITEGTIEFKLVTMFTPCCAGVMCGAQKCWQNGRKKEGTNCGCMSNQNRHRCIPLPVCTIQAEITNPDEASDTKTILFSGFVDRHFTTKYIYKDLPGGSCSLHDFTNNPNAYIDLNTAIDEMVRYINANGGWRMIGYFKRGMIRDPAAPPLKTNEVDDGRFDIESANEIFNLVALDFAKPESIEIEAYRDLMFDMNAACQGKSRKELMKKDKEGELDDGEEGNHTEEDFESS